MKVIVFTLRDVEFGAVIEVVKEVAKAKQILRMKKQPRFASGAIELRDGVIPVVDLRKRFEYKIEPAKKISVIIIEEKENFGIVVDRVKGILNIQPGSIDSVPEAIVNSELERFFRGIGKIDSRLVIIIDPSKILSKDELKKLWHFKRRVLKNRSDAERMSSEDYGK